MCARLHFLHGNDFDDDDCADEGDAASFDDVDTDDMGPVMAPNVILITFIATAVIAEAAID